MKREDHVRIAAMFYAPAADATIFSNSATEIAYGLAKRLMPDLIE